MKRQVWHFIGVVLLTALVLGEGQVTWGAGTVLQEEEPPQVEQTQADNLLVNGSMEAPMDWYPPNHFVARGWLRWWIHGSPLGEYTLSQEDWAHKDGESSQRYHKWGDPYTQGVYQVVTGVMPCAPYRLTMWARNHALDGVLPHARIGLDPQGTQLTPSADDPAVKTGLPSDIVWSQEQTALFTWEELSVEAEPAGDRLTAILYASPEPPNDGRAHFYDTYWDAGSLTTATFPDGKLPAPASWEPSSFITRVASETVSGELTIEWEIAQPAPTQVWYTVIAPPPPSPTPTVTLTHTVYVPLAMRYEEPSLQGLDLYTPVEQTPATQHRVVISGLEEGQTVKFVVLARRPADGICRTDHSALFWVTVP